MNELANAGGIAGIGVAMVIVGRVLKGVPKFPDEWIPTALSVIGGLLSVLTEGWSVSNLVEGLAAGLAAVGANQAFRQHTKSDETTHPPPVPPAGSG